MLEFPVAVKGAGPTTVQLVEVDEQISKLIRSCILREIGHYDDSLYWRCVESVLSSLHRFNSKKGALSTWIGRIVMCRVSDQVRVQKRDEHRKEKLKKEARPKKPVGPAHIASEDEENAGWKSFFGR